MKNNLSWLFVLSLAMLAGCNALTPYKEPLSSNPSSKIRFATDINELTFGMKNIVVASWDDESCQLDKTKLIAFLIGPAIAHQRKGMGMPLGEAYSDKNKTEIAVYAERPLIFSMAINTAGVYNDGERCFVRASLTPRPNKMYEATFGIAGNTCKLHVSRLEQDSNGHFYRTPEETVRFLPQDCGKR